jgi:hypothetical protein
VFNPFAQRPQFQGNISEQIQNATISVAEVCLRVLNMGDEPECVPKLFS